MGILADIQAKRLGIKGAVRTALEAIATVTNNGSITVSKHYSRRHWPTCSTGKNY